MHKTQLSKNCDFTLFNSSAMQYNFNFIAFILELLADMRLNWKLYTIFFKYTW